MNPSRVTRTAAAAALTLSFVAAGTAPADATTTRNPLTSPTASKPGDCQVRKTQNIRGNDRLVAHFGGGWSTDPTYVIRSMRAAGFSWSEIPAALAVARGESKLCAHARHYNRSTRTGAIRSTDYGMFQINTRWHPWAKRYDLDSVGGNMRAARRVYVGAGKSWKPWHASKYSNQYLPWARGEVAKARKAGVR